LFFGLGYFVVMLLPVLGFLNIYFMRYSLVADHWQYFAIIGPIALAAALIRRPVVAAALLLALGALTWRQCGMYANAETLWETTLRVNPDCWLAQNNLGMDLLDKEGQVDEAIPHFEKALQIQPDYAEAYINLGNCLYRQGRMDEAIAHYQKAVEIKPDDVEAHSNLGGALLQKGKAGEAVAHLQKALQINPNFAGTRCNLGLSFFLLGRMGEAISQYQKALEIQPDYAEAQKSLAWILATCPQAALRNSEKAVELARQANVQTGGENPIMLHTLAAALAEAGQFSEAVETAQHALRLTEAQSNAKLAGQLQVELKLYQAGSPFHSPEQTH
jgi:tetratricopeptide (TPR) repeat protein